MLRWYHCHVHSSESLTAIRQRLKADDETTTADLMFTLETAPGAAPWPQW